MRIITLVHKLYYTVRTSPLTLAVPYSTPCGSKTKYYYSLYVLFRSRYILLKLIVILYCTPYFTAVRSPIDKYFGQCSLVRLRLIGSAYSGVATRP